MRRPRRSSKNGVDLIGFLDILSAVMVIVLLVISVLALSIGEQGTTQAATEQIPTEALEPRASPALVEITTVDGQDVTEATTFLLCKDDRLEQFDPGNGEKINSWSLGTTSAAVVAGELAATNVYLAVSGSCFPSLDSLVEAFRASGSQLGYEPTSEEAALPWQ